MPTNKSLTTQQVADRLGVSQATLAAWRKAKTGPEWVRLARYIVYGSETVEAWAAEHTQAALKDAAEKK